MNIYSPILSLFGMGGLSNPDQGFQHASVSTRRTETGLSVSDEQAMRVSAVWSCVSLIANSVASLPLNVYRKTDAGREEITERHYLVDLLKHSPNPYMKPRDFRLAMTVQQALWNNAYARVDWMGDRPVSVLPLRPGRMQVFITEDNELQYHYSTTKGIEVYSPRSILHLKGIGSEGLVGFERLSFARETLGLSVSAEVYAAKQFANGGNSAGGYLMFDDFLTVEQRNQARKLYEGMAENAYDANRLWILEGGVKYEANTLPPDAMQMIQTRQMQIGEIARFFGVPEVLLGSNNATSAWPASFEQQILSFLTFTLQSYLDEWECAITDSLMIGQDPRNLSVDHDVTGFIKTDSQAKASYLSTLAQNGFISRNEGRKALNYQEVNGADELTVQTNLTPVDQLASVQDATQNSQPNQPMQPQIRQ